MTPRTLYIGLELGGATGWSQWGLYVGWYAAKAGWTVFVAGADLTRAPLAIQHAERWFSVVNPDKPLAVDVAIMSAGNRFVQRLPENIVAQRLAIATFVEDAHIDLKEIAAYNEAAVTICGSRWNTDLLTAAGVTNAVTCVQGVDTDSWNRDVRKRRVFGDRRVVFSGGKLELRKGQPILYEAFRRYLAEDPDALLLCANENIWPTTMRGIELFGYTKGWPPIKGDGSLDIPAWLEKFGIPRRNVRSVGLLPNWALPSVVVEANVAIFPNLAEGGNNVPACECLALGIPTFVTDCTGQKETIAWGAIPMGGEPVTWQSPLYKSTEGWGQPTVETVLSALQMTRAMTRGGSHFPSSPVPPAWEFSARDILYDASGAEQSEFVQRYRTDQAAKAARAGMRP